MSYETPKLKSSSPDYLPEETLTQDTYNDQNTTPKFSKQSPMMFETDFLISPEPIGSPNNLHGYYYNRPQSLINGVMVFRSRRRVQSFNERMVKEPSSARKSVSDDYSAKYKTEICKNFEFKGICQWGDNVR